MPPFTSSPQRSHYFIISIILKNGVNFFCHLLTWNSIYIFFFYKSYCMQSKWLSFLWDYVWLNVLKFRGCDRKKNCTNTCSVFLAHVPSYCQFISRTPIVPGTVVTNFPQVNTQPQIWGLTSSLCTFLYRIWVEEWVEGFKNFGDGGASTSWNLQ